MIVSVSNLATDLDHASNCFCIILFSNIIQSMHPYVFFVFFLKTIVQSILPFVFYIILLDQCIHPIVFHARSFDGSTRRDKVWAPTSKKTSSGPGLFNSSEAEEIWAPSISREDIFLSRKETSESNPEELLFLSVDPSPSENLSLRRRGARTTPELPPLLARLDLLMHL